jgi:hypothetical protein
MSTEKSLSPCKSCYYRITVEGKIDSSWSDWLSGMQLISLHEIDDITVTTLSGIVIDQAALRGLVNRLWDLNLVVRAVEQVNPTPVLNK